MLLKIRPGNFREGDLVVSCVGDGRGREVFVGVSCLVPGGRFVPFIWTESAFLLRSTSETFVINLVSHFQGRG